MNQRKTDNRQSRRFTISLSAALVEDAHVHKRPGPIKGTLISFSAGGCAIRTTTRLDQSERFEIEVPLVIHDRPQTLKIPAEVVWGRDDFRIDTFYVQGLKFLQPLKDEFLLDVLKEEALAAQMTGQHPSILLQKSVA